MDLQKPKFKSSDFLREPKRWIRRDYIHQNVIRIVDVARVVPLICVQFYVVKISIDGLKLGI